MSEFRSFICHPRHASVAFHRSFPLAGGARLLLRLILRLALFQQLLENGDQVELGIGKPAAPGVDRRIGAGGINPEGEGGSLI